MGFLDGIVQKIRNDADNVGSFFTGMPAHGTPAPQQPQAPQQSFQPQAPQFQPQQQTPFNNPSATLSLAPTVPNTVPQLQQRPPQSMDLLHNPVTNFVGNNFVKPVIDTADKSYHTIAAGVSAGNALVGNLTGNQQAQNNALRSVQSDLAPGKAFMNYQQASSGGDGTQGFVNNIAKPVANASAQIAPLVVGPELAGVAKGAPLATRLAINAGGNAAIGGGATAAQELAQTGHINGNDVLKSASQNAALGVAGEGIHAATPIVRDAVSPVVNNAVDGIKAVGNDEGGFLGIGKVANAQAEKATGIKAANIINDNEAGTLRDFADYITGDQSGQNRASDVTQLFQRAKNAADTAGIAIHGTNKHEIVDNIYNYLSQRRQFVQARDTFNQGGYAKIPGVKASRTPDSESVYRSEHPDRYGVGQAELGSGLYAGSKDIAGRLQDGKIVTDGLHEYKVNPEANILDSNSSEFRTINSKASNDPSLSSLGGRAWQQRKADIMAQLVKEKGYDGVKRGTNQIVAMSDKAFIPVSKDAPVYKPNFTNTAQPLSDEELDIGRALGMSDSEVASAKAGLKTKPATDIPEMSIPHELDTSKRIPKSMEPVRPELSAAENTAKNPTKIDIPEVKAGDYEKARSNAQLASNPIEYSTGQVIKAVHALAPKEKANFWKAVENPDLPMTPKLREAVTRWNDLSNRVHATSQALGGNTGYLKNYARHNWDLSNPEDAAQFQELVNARGGQAIDPYNFSGLDRQPRVFNTIQEGEQAGFKLSNPNDPTEDILKYGAGSASALKKQALVKGITEADMNEPLKNRSFDLKNGQTISVSERGNKELQGFDRLSKPEGGHNLYRTANKKLKQTLLSASEFHPVNISLLKAAPAEALAGHPVLAAKGAYGTFRAQIGRKYSDRLQQAALKDGTVDAAARLGTPIKYGTDYSAEGKLELGKSGLGERTIFEKAMPAMHIRMVQGLVKDLERKGISLDSPEARAAGDVINKTMGFMNTEVKNHNPHVQRALSDLALAPQFTRSKWSLLKDALSPQSYTKGGVAGKYAASAIVGNSAAAAAVSIGLGYLLHQKSDNTQDAIVRGIVHPSVPTPLKDSKGNTIELGLPSTYLSEVLGLGANVKRNQNGRLGINIKPQNIPGNVANYGRARLASLPAVGLKLATNTDYAGKQLYDPNAPFKVKAEQAATTISNGLLPIGAQGLAQTNIVKSHLPEASQEILNANKPGTNGLEKSVLSAIGLTPRTDKTVGQGLQTSQYFDALNEATKGLDTNDKAAFASIHQQTKDPVTGQYIIQPTVFDSAAKAELYLQHPNVLAADTALNQKLAQEGQAVDPFFSLSNEQQRQYLAHETVDKNNTAQLAVDAQNMKDWLPQFQQARSVFYNSLPPGDPNRPKSPIQAPTQTADVQQAFQQYDTITDPAQRAAFFGQHPELGDYLDKQADYTNQMLSAQGLTPLKKVPKADADTQSFTSAYMAGTPDQRKALKAGNPDGYNKMEAYMQNVSEYEVAKNGALDQLQGQTPNQKLLKGINSLATYDMLKNPDGSLALKYGTTGGDASQYGSVSALPQAGALKLGGSGSSGSSFAKRQARYVRKIKTVRAPKHYASNPRKYGKVTLRVKSAVKPSDKISFTAKKPKVTHLKSSASKPGALAV